MKFFVDTAEIDQIKELNDANKGDDVEAKIETMRAQLVSNHEAKVKELQAVIATISNNNRTTME